jgi:hypothetical protein
VQISQCAFQIWNTSLEASLYLNTTGGDSHDWINLAQKRDQLWPYYRSGNVLSNVIEGKYFIEQLSDCRLYRNGCLHFAYFLEPVLCDLVVRVPGYRFRGPGSIPGATRFSEK